MEENTVIEQVPEWANGPKHHHLKVWTEYFQDLVFGVKTFEARKNDRDFRSGDYLVLREWDKEKQEYTNRIEVRLVTYILRGPAFGIAEGYCVMALARQESTESASQKPQGETLDDCQTNLVNAVAAIEFTQDMYLKEKSRTEAAEKRVQELEAYLQSIQWSEAGFCPQCGEHKDFGHKGDCKLGKVRKGVK